MNEFDFPGLREASTRAFKPEFADVEDRVRRRRRTRGLSAAALTAAVAAGAGVTLAGLLPGSSQGPSNAAARLGTSGFIATPAPSGSPSGSIQARGTVVAGDLRHLYMSYADCRDSGKECTPAVASTEDGGDSWRTSSLSVPKGSRVVLKALAPRTVLAWVLPMEPEATSQTRPTHRPAGQPAKAANYGTPYWLSSADGATTWRRVEVREAARIPEGFQPLTDIAQTEPMEVLAASATTGEIVRMTTSVGLEQARVHDDIPASDGVWVTGYGRHRIGNVQEPNGSVSEGKYIFEESAVEVSHDSGQTWHRTVLPANIAAAEGQGADLAVARDAVYAVGQAAGELYVYRSTDQGRSWQRTTASAHVGDRSIQAGVRSDGTLLIQAGTLASENPIMFASSDRGDTLREVDPGPGASAIAVEGGYAQTGTQDQRGVWLSTDGSTWSYINEPAIS